MKRLIIFLICFCSLLPAEAQVTRYLARKGTKVDFDTAMVIKLEAYRKDFEIEMEKSKLIDSLQQVLAAQQRQDTILAERPAPLPAQEKLPEIVVDEKKGLKWYFNPILYLGAGLLMGVYLVD